jgi:hypothetical protein
MQLIHDILLMVILVVGLFLAAVPAILVVVIGFALGFLPSANWVRKSTRGKSLSVAGIVIAGIGLAILWSSIVKVVSQAGSGIPTLGSQLSGFAIIATVVALLAVTTTTVMTYTYATYRTLTERLRPGAARTHFGRSSEQTEARIAEVQAAQWGNVTLYSGQESALFGSPP